MNIDLKELSRYESERVVERKENATSTDDIVGMTAVVFADNFSNLGGKYVVGGAKRMFLPIIPATHLHHV